MVYRIDTAWVTAAWLQSIQMDARRILKDEKIGHDGVLIADKQVRVTLRDPGGLDLALSRLKTLAVRISSWPWRPRYDLTVTGADNGLITIEPTPEGLRQRLESVLWSSFKAVRRRADPEGAGEAIVALEGKDGISVRVPSAGVSDVKARIGARTKLTFQLVDNSMTAVEARRTGVPPGDELLPDKENPGRFVLVNKESAVSDGDLQGVVPGIAPVNGMPALNFELNARGSAAFARVTRENIGKTFAIVLDGQVLSAPMIRSEIAGGRGQITGGFSKEEVKRLSFLLSSGAISATLSLAGERPAAQSGRRLD